jgi:hypothetical protein
MTVIKVYSYISGEYTTLAFWTVAEALKHIEIIGHKKFEMLTGKFVSESK